MTGTIYSDVDTVSLDSELLWFSILNPVALAKSTILQTVFLKKPKLRSFVFAFLSA